MLQGLEDYNRRGKKHFKAYRGEIDDYKVLQLFPQLPQRYNSKSTHDLDTKLMSTVPQESSLRKSSGLPPFKQQSSLKASLQQDNITVASHKSKITSNKSEIINLNEKTPENKSKATPRDMTQNKVAQPNIVYKLMDHEIQQYVYNQKKERFQDQKPIRFNPTFMSYASQLLNQKYIQ